MLGHLGLNVPDVDGARVYYGEVLPLLDYEPFLSEEDGFAYMPAQGKRGTYLFFYPASTGGPYSRQRPGLQHLAFTVPTRTAVRRVHERVVGLGSEVLHPPQEFPAVPAALFRHLLARPLRVHARSRVPPRSRVNGLRE